MVRRPSGERVGNGFLRFHSQNESSDQGTRRADYGMAERKKHLSIRGKMTVMVSTFVLTMVAAVSMTSWVRIDSILGEDAMHRTHDVVSVIAKLVGPEKTPEEILAYFEDLQSIGITGAMVLDGEGSIRATWPNDDVIEKLKLPQGRTSVVEGAEITVARPISDSEKSGFLFVRIASSELLQRARGSSLIVIALGVLFGLIGIAIAFGTGRAFFMPLENLTKTISEIVDTRDLTKAIKTDSKDEVGVLSTDIQQLVGEQRSLLDAMRRSNEGMSNVINQLSQSGMTVSSGAVTIQSLVRDTASAIESMQHLLRGVGINVDGLQESSERGAAFIVEMATANDQIAGNIETMATAVQQSTAAIDRMTSSIQESAGNIEDLEGAIAETFASMTDVSKAISQVERSAHDTAKLSAQATHDASLGGEALQATLLGIDRINDATQTAFEVISSLVRGTEQIGAIIVVIKGVADQTNLLALNASIIASQSGEHGKGFGVVAVEIKNLAERTRVSTSEIGSLIETIREESDRAMDAMRRGMDNVDQGVRVGRQAGEAFQKILESTSSSGNMVQEIASAARKHAQRIKELTQSMQRVAQSAKGIARSSTEQATNSRDIRDGTRRMNALTEQVHASSTEQAQGSRQVIQAIEEINEMVGQVNSAQQMQTRSSEEVLQAIQLIHDVCGDQDASMRELDQSISSLTGEARNLSEELERFRA